MADTSSHLRKLRRLRKDDFDTEEEDFEIQEEDVDDEDARIGDLDTQPGSPSESMVEAVDSVISSISSVSKTGFCHTVSMLRSFNQLFSDDSASLASGSVRFDLDSVEEYEVVPYSEIYGAHPKDFVFGSIGQMLPSEGDGSIACISSVGSNDAVDQPDASEPELPTLMSSSVRCRCGTGSAKRLGTTYGQVDYFWG
jgi:hypothetical protein